ncbi:MAG TPA: GGDEF domain-containing protein [Dermatophilaceae bacterium]
MSSPNARSLTALGVLAAATVAYPFVPLSGDTWRVYYDVVAIGAMLIAFLGVAHNAPHRRRAWLFVIGGFGGWVVGDLMASVEQNVWHLPTYPVPSDVIFLGAYGFLAAGALMMVRSRGAGRDMTALLDATIIAAGAGVVAAVFLIPSLTSDSELTGFGKVISSAYPVADVLLIAVIARMWTAPGARTASYRLLVSALGMTLAGDVIWDVLVAMNGTQLDRWSDQVYLASYVLIGFAACVPSMTTLTEPAPGREATTSAQRRLVVLAAGLMLPAVTLLIDGALGGAVLWPVIGLGALLISGLVLVRMSGILHTVEAQAVQLAALARADGLTGAPNRRTWDYELSRACAASLEHHTALCVAMMDIDFFKAYNDTRGHQAGDRLLREAVAAWTERLGAGTLLARYGGEEFTVLLPGVTLAEAQARIQALSAVTPDGQTFSAGVSSWDPNTDPSSLVARADQALYEAKRTGRDRVLAYCGSSHPAPVPSSAPAPSLAGWSVGAGTVDQHEALARLNDRPGAA